MATNQQWKIGAHKLRFEAPDLLIFELVGVASAANSSKITEVFKLLGEKAPYYLIVDFTHLEKMEPEVRAHVGKEVKSEWILGCAYINASLVTKMAVKGMNALMFLAGKSSFKGVFVSSEAEARAGIAELRRERERQLKSA